MIVKEVCHRASYHSLLVEIMGREYLLECVMSRLKCGVSLTNRNDGKQLKSYGLSMAQRALEEYFLGDKYINAQSFVVYLLYVFKGLNLGFKVTPDEENREKFIGFISKMFECDVQLEYEVNLYGEELGNIDVERWKYSCWSSNELSLTPDLGLVQRDIKTGKWYRVDLDSAVNAYVMFQYCLGGSDVRINSLLCNLGLFVRACVEYNR